MNADIKSRIRIADVLLVVILLIACVASAVYFWRKPEHSLVYVYKNNILLGEYPLDEDRDISIDSHNRLQIADHKVRMVYADCPDKRCVKQGASNMFPIICLPNKVVVEIRNLKGDKQFLLY